MEDDDVNIFNFWNAHHRRVEEEERPRRQLTDIIEDPRRGLRRKLAALGSVRVELLHMLHLPTLRSRIIPDYEQETARTKMVRVLHDGEFITLSLMDHYERYYEYTLDYRPLVRLESFRPSEAFPMEMILLI